MVKLCVICPNPLTDTIESFLRKSCYIKSWTVRWRKQDYQADRNEGWRLLLEILSRGRMQLPFPSHPFQLTLSHFEPESGSLMLSVLSLSRCECRPYYCLCRCCCCSKVHYPCDCCCCSTGMRESMANNPSQNYIWSLCTSFNRLSAIRVSKRFRTYLIGEILINGKAFIIIIDYASEMEIII